MTKQCLDLQFNCLVFATEEKLTGLSMKAHWLCWLLKNNNTVLETLIIAQSFAFVIQFDKEQALKVRTMWYSSTLGPQQSNDEDDGDAADDV